MGLLQDISRLLNPIKAISQLPVDATKSINRTSPWGQANQRAFNNNSNKIVQRLPIPTQAPQLPSMNVNGGYTGINKPNTSILRYAENGPAYVNPYEGQPSQNGSQQFALPYNMNTLPKPLPRLKLL